MPWSPHSRSPHAVLPRREDRDHARQLDLPKALAEFGRTEALKKGATVTYFDAITPGQKDYTSSLTRVASTSPDTFYFTGYYPEAGALVKEYKDLGLDSKFKNDHHLVRAKTDLTLVCVF